MPLVQSSNQDGLGSSIIAGEGVAGTPTGGVISVQGVINGTAVPVIDPADATSSSINITTQDLVSTTTTGFANQSLITGIPTAGSAASYSLNSIQTVMILINGTWTGTLNTEVSEDSGVTWEPRSIHVVGTSTFASAITANVVGSMNSAGKTNVRVRASTTMTGTAAVKIVMSDNPSNVYIANSIKLVDGSSTPNVNMLTIKAGSTLSAITDTAAVFTLRDTATVQGPSGAAGTPSGGILTIQGALAGSQVPTRDVLNTAGQNRAQSVTTTAAEALGAATILVNRKSLSIRPTNGIIYWGFIIGVTTTTGTPIYTNEVFTISATDNLHIYVIAAQTTDVRISEAS